MNQFELMLAAAERGEALQTVTLIDGPACALDKLGQMLLIFSGGRVDGSLVDAEFTAQVLAELNGKEWTKPAIHKTTYRQDEFRLFWDSVGVGRLKVVLLGGGHISQPLAQIFSILGFEVTIVDDRVDFANPQRFPQAEKVICRDFRRALQELSLDEGTAVIIVTRGHRHDVDCLRGVIDSKAGYIGMIGSSLKVRSVLDLMTEDGVSQERLARVKAPIGLDIGAQGPAEIALSIAAEVLAAFRGGNCLPLSAHRR